MTTPSIRVLTPHMVRRLVIARQHLSAAPTPTMLDVIRDLGCLQLDPTSAVARSHLLVLWSRLGGYDVVELDRLLWQERSLFEYWAHAASIVLTEDYPVHRLLMDKTATSNSAWSQRVLKWVDDNRALHDHILAEIKQRGALPSKHFEDKSSDSWYSSGWTSNRNVSQMLGHLWDKGTIMVAARKGGHRYWDLAERVLPDWTPRESLTPHDVTRRAAQKSLRALGVGQARHIVQHYTRSRYHNLPAVLAELEAERVVERVAIADKGQHWPGDWYIHTADLPLLEQLEAGDWQPRTTLLSPFDNLICDRARTELLFDFEFRIEIYVPKNKRKYGYYVLPILHDDQLIGRIDPLMNRKQQKLVVNAIYAEPHAPKTRTAARAVQQAIESLADFLGAKAVDYTERIPAAWKPVFRRS